MVKEGHNFHPAYRPDIDGLRAVAVLSVLAFHLFPAAIHGGFVGVDVFFVISGFLISGIILKSLERGDFSFAEFYAHRVRRIFPALAVILAVSYVVGWFALLPDEFKLLGKHIAAGAGFVENFVLWKEAGYFDTASELKPLLHLWSLSVEEQFYLAYPLMLWCGWRLGAKPVYLIAALALWSFGLNITGMHKEAVKTFFLPQSRFWELFAGGLLAYVHFINRPASHATADVAPGPPRASLVFHACSIAGAALVAATVVFLRDGKTFPGWWALPPVLGSCLLIHAGPAACVNRWVLARPAMVFIGLISYPLYLWHWPILSFARIVESGTPSAPVRAAIGVASVLLAWLTYRFVERPVRFGPRTNLRVAAVVASIAFAGLIGWQVFVKEGMPFRVKDFTARNEYLNWGDKANSNCRYASPQFATLEYCLLARPNAPTVMLAGDSHANSLYPGLVEALKDTPETLINIGGGGCLPFFGLASLQRGATDNCRAFEKISMGYAEDSPLVRTIVMTARWPLYLSGVGYFEPGYDWVLTLREDLRGGDSAGAFTTTMEDTLQRLLAKGKRVIFVLDVPELGFHPGACIDTRPLRLTHHVRTPCAVAREAFDARQRASRQLIASILKKFPAVKVYDPANELCDRDQCWAYRDGVMLYRDDDHLSLAGSRIVGRRIAALIAGAP